MCAKNNEFSKLYFYFFSRAFWKSIFHKNQLEMVPKWSWMWVCSLLDQNRENRRSENPQKNKNHFFKNLLFFAHMEIHQGIVNQIPGPGYNWKFKKVRAQFFFTFFLKFTVPVTFWWDSLYIWSILGRNPEISEISENRPGQNRDIFKTIWTFSKNVDVLESRWIGLASWAN